MHRRCPPAAALDLLASVPLRQHRARAFFLHYRPRRLFSAGLTEPVRWHVEPRELGESRWRDEGEGLKVTGYEVPAGVRKGEAMPLEEGDGEWREGDWHAEVEVKGQGEIEPAARVDVAAAGTGAVAMAGREKTAVAGHSAAGGSLSRAESRLARRQRRELAGKYKPGPSVVERPVVVEEGEVDDGRDTVLKMIENMEGPKIQKAKAKVPKAEKAEGEKDAKAAENEKRGKRGKKDKEARSIDRKNWKATTANGKLPPPSPKPKREDWQIQKAANRAKLGEAVWEPRKRLSPDTLDGIRALHASDPATYSTETLAKQFEVSPENIRRVLKSKWRPTDAEKEERSKRWERRGVRKWSEMAAQGSKPPQKWRVMGVGSVKGEPDQVPAWKKRAPQRPRQTDEQDYEEEFGERIL